VTLSLTKGSAACVSPFIRPRAVADPVLRLIVFHHAGGSAATYFPMSRHLPASWDIALLDLPGRGKRVAAQPLTAMASVVQRAIADLEPLRDVPVALFGHSLGAILAWEVARAWSAAGEPPQWVGVSGRVPGRHVVGSGPLHKLDDSALMAELTALGGVPAWLDSTPEFRTRFLRLTRADLTAVESYRPGPQDPLPCPLASYGGADDPWAPPAAMQGWARLTTARFTQRTYPGGHFYFGGAALAGFVADLVDDASHVLMAAR
jgi:medium-chain acyl-[acyl-carrier-protein] hydrolase